MVQFRSFEETLVLIGALAAVVVTWKLLKASALTSVVAGLLVGCAIAYATFFEFTLRDDVITYRNRYTEDHIPLAWVEKVGMTTFWAGLPGRTYTFILKRPPAPLNGYFRRTGLVTWPSASEWVDTVNAAIRDAKAAGRP